MWTRGYCTTRRHLETILLILDGSGLVTPLLMRLQHIFGEPFYVKLICWSALATKQWSAYFLATHPRSTSDQHSLAAAALGCV